MSSSASAAEIRSAIATAARGSTVLTGAVKRSSIVWRTWSRSAATRTPAPPASSTRAEPGALQAILVIHRGPVHEIRQRCRQCRRRDSEEDQMRSAQQRDRRTNRRQPWTRSQSPRVPCWPATAGARRPASTALITLNVARSTRPA